ncbi:hypothetical protein [Streptomyces sp. F-1]|uniref:hypothetical protein n=1 Tax=Streptomyces sp. F-1 TaxID=463642 RepID=UPI001161031A|nr:hypothetical protein [Streptomyces sp. F-1]
MALALAWTAASAAAPMAAIAACRQEGRAHARVARRERLAAGADLERADQVGRVLESLVVRLADLGEDRVGEQVVLAFGEAAAGRARCIDPQRCSRG